MSSDFCGGVGIDRAGAFAGSSRRQGEFLVFAALGLAFLRQMGPIGGGPDAAAGSGGV